MPELALRGEALGQLGVSGAVHVRRAELRVPERMPAAIAVLPVDPPGAKPAQPASEMVIALNIALDAQQIHVRGRGLDVEFGGAMKFGEFRRPRAPRAASICAAARSALRRAMAGA